MPKTKVQGVVFGLLMSYVMAYGMEVYNVAIKEGFNLNVGGLSTMTNQVFLGALIEASYMGAFVFITSFPDGIFLEHVCRCTVLPFRVRQVQPEER